MVTTAFRFQIKCYNSPQHCQQCYLQCFCIIKIQTKTTITNIQKFATWVSGFCLSAQTANLSKQRAMQYADCGQNNGDMINGTVTQNSMN